MGEFVKFEEDEDYWFFKPKYDLEFSKLKAINYCSWFNKKSEIRTLIEAYEEIDQPSEAQIETLAYIVKHQQEILEAIYRFNERFIFPIFKQAIDIEEDEVVNDLSQLSRVYGIKYIEIPILKEANSYYFLIRFDFRYDDEHGLYFLFENSSVIDFFGEGDKNEDAIEIYQNGLKNDNDKPLDISLYSGPSPPIHRCSHYFNETIDYPLKKGAYRARIVCNGTSYCINFYVPDDLQNFSLQQALTMK